MLGAYTQDQDSDLFLKLMLNEGFRHRSRKQALMFVSATYTYLSFTVSHQIFSYMRVIGVSLGTLS